MSNQFVMRFNTRLIKILFFFFASMPVVVFSQPNAGDYRSNAATGDWNVAATWQRFDGTVWVAAVAAPSSTDGVITILNPHTVTINTAISADEVTVDVGGTLTITSTLTIDDGTGTDLAVNGTMNLSGTLGGSGSVTVNGLITWTNSVL